MTLPAELRSFHHSLFPVERIVAERKQSISVCLPARECAPTVGAIVAVLGELRAAGAIDEIVVIDAASPDGTAERARNAGASVHQESELLSELGPCLGKGDAMWRALTVLTGDVVVYLDADSEGFQSHFATGLIGPLVCHVEGEGEGDVDGDIDFVKAFYERPFVQAGISLPRGGGRVNHLTARPALALFYPELQSVRQPLAGEIGATRELLEKLPFASGYGVEIGMLIDVHNEVGLAKMAQVDLDLHHNRHQPLLELSTMAQTILGTIASRLEREGRLSADDPAMKAASEQIERRPLLSLQVS